MLPRRGRVINARAGGYSELSKMGRLANDQVPWIVERSGQQGRTRMREMMDEPNSRLFEADLLKVIQKWLHRDFDEAALGRIEPPVEKDGSCIALATHRNEASYSAFDAEQHQAGIFENRGDIHAERR